MERAAILIGVNRTGELPALNAAASGARKMASWADAQAIPQMRIRLITDDDGAGVTVQQIKDAVKAFACLRTVEQLIIYFAGHGMWSHGSEYWLLSGAPGDQDEAVNISKSQDQARIGVFNHVIFISDACRTAAPDRRFQSVEGSSIFPNPKEPATPERSVDLFFACGFDSPSSETGKPGEPETWRSVYTDVLHDVLKGEYPLALMQDEHEGAAAASVRTQKLKPFLAEQVPNAIIAGGGSLVSTPDARVTSPYEAWVSMLCPPPPGFIPGGRFVKVASQQAQMEKSTALLAVSAALYDPALSPMERMPKAELRFTDSAGETDLPKPPAVTRDASRIIRSDKKSPKSFDTGCGFFVSGATVRSARVLGGVARIDELAPDAVKVVTAETVSVMLRFDNDHGTVLPAIPGFIATVTCEKGMLLSVSWKRVHEPEPTELQELRAIIASLSQRGAFQLDAGVGRGAGNAELLAERIRDAKTTDPSMAIYAAYAFYDLNLSEQTSRMAKFLAERIPVNFFDFALLTRTLHEVAAPGSLPRRPFFPLLSRGWPLLERSDLPPGLGNLRFYLADSQWTLFNEDGLALIQSVAELGAVSL